MFEDPTLYRCWFVAAFLVLGTVLPPNAWGQRPGFNYDESQVPDYTLPEVLVASDGTKVESPEAWREKRRPELLALFKEHVYGTMPPPLPIAHVDIAQIDENALEGRAVRKEVTLYFRDDRTGPALNVLIYLPKEASVTTPVPAFLGCNFLGNHATHATEPIQLGKTWDKNTHQSRTADESSRGERASRWPAELIVERGYALVTLHYYDIDPDFDDGFKNGVHALYPEYVERDDNWGSIGAWAWGLSRVLDYLETEGGIDTQRVAVIGHSRLGKTALWAGACDERFALVISNNSGCGGAALSRREFGETVARINTAFPHWFCTNHKQYGKRVNELPVDQHQLIALIAPRPVYVASAAQDLWADPRGEFLSCVGADPVYRLLGTEGLPSRDYPEVGSPIQGQIGYHVRTGPHDLKRYDWEQFLNFADKHLGGAEGAGQGKD